jgi:hypothetical protein
VVEKRVGKGKGGANGRGGGGYVDDDGVSNGRFGVLEARLLEGCDGRLDEAKRRIARVLNVGADRMLAKKRGGSTKSKIQTKQERTTKPRQPPPPHTLASCGAMPETERLRERARVKMSCGFSSSRSSQWSRNARY